MPRRTIQQSLGVVAQEMPISSDRIERDIENATFACDAAYNALAQSVETRTQFKVKLPVSVESQLSAQITAAAIKFIAASIALSDVKALYARHIREFNGAAAE